MSLFDFCLLVVIALEVTVNFEIRARGGIRIARRVMHDSALDLQRCLFVPTTKATRSLITVQRVDLCWNNRG